MNNQPSFTSDWTTTHHRNWRRILEPLHDSPCAVLEIGSWEGRSALFFLNYLPRSHITCVDTFAGGLPYDPSAAANSEAIFDENLRTYEKRVEKIKGRSATVLANLLLERRWFDLIYIDGSHEADDVLIDSALSWPMLKAGGILIWDDYGVRTDNMPRLAIDPFLLMHRGDYVLLHRAYQIAVQRKEVRPVRAARKLRRWLFRHI